MGLGALDSARRLVLRNPADLDDLGRCIQRNTVAILSDQIEAAEGFKHPNDCPECQQGKHVNCTGWALDEDTDDMVECGCAEGGHL